MEIIRSGRIQEKTAVALGNFDGLHKAHMSIIENCRDYAKENGFKSGVLLFSDHTLNIINNSQIKLITDEENKLDILARAGLDFAYIRDFNKEFMRLSPTQFVCELINTINPNTVFVGYDYRFGYKAEGDTTLLKQLGDKNGFRVIVTDKISHKGVPIKSTDIRSLIENGNVSSAGELLGRAFSVSGTVVSGLQNGRKIGIPTVNLDYKPNIALPKNGVYTGFTRVGDKLYKSVINVGNNPTFNADKITVESHLLDFNEEIYGEKVSVLFTDRIRDDKKFSSIDELKEQIQKDISVARKVD